MLLLFRTGVAIDSQGFYGRTLHQQTLEDARGEFGYWVFMAV